MRRGFFFFAASYLAYGAAWTRPRSRLVWTPRGWASENASFGTPINYGLPCSRLPSCGSEGRWPDTFEFQGYEQRRCAL